MKNRLSSYRAAYLEATHGKTHDEMRRITKRFFFLIVRERGLSRVEEIIRTIRRAYLKKRGRRKVLLESAAALAPSRRNEISRLFGKDAIIREVVDSGILAGIKIIIDDELVVDASGKSILDRMLAPRIHS